MSLVLRSNINRRLTVQEMDGNFTYLENLAQTGGTGGGGVIEKTYSQLVSLMNTSALAPGTYYLITDFRTCYDQPDFDYNGNAIYGDNYRASDIHPLMVLAISENQISTDAYQPDYPKDKIKYDISFTQSEVTGGTAYGRITERIDEFNNRTDYDHRNIKFKRYKTRLLDGTAPGRILSMTDGLVIGTNSNFLNDFNIGSVVFIEYTEPEFYKVIDIFSDTEMQVEGFTYYNFSDPVGYVYQTTYTDQINNVAYTHTQMSIVDEQQQASIEDFTFDGVVENGTSYFGATSSYFTNLYPGLFVLSAYNTNINTFSITGNVGADGSGIVEVGTFSYGGFTIFTKTVYDAGDPSINQIIMVNSNDETITRTYDPNADWDNHELFNIDSVTQIHYILFGLKSGVKPTSQQVQDVYQSYIDLIDTNDINNTLSILNSSYTNITDNLPPNSNDPGALYYFNDMGGNDISDGGNDMYDGGNIISTNLCLFSSLNAKQTNIVDDNFSYREILTFDQGVENALTPVYARNTYIGNSCDSWDWEERPFMLPNNVFTSAFTNNVSVFDNYFGNRFTNNTFGNDVYTNTIGDYSINNTFYNSFYGNEIGSEFSINTCYDQFANNKIGNYFSENRFIDGDGVYDNQIGNQFNNNIFFSDYSLNNNKIDNNFYGNKIYRNFFYNNIDISFYNNNIYNSFNKNTIKNDFHDNTVGLFNNIGSAEFYRNDIGENVKGNIFVGYVSNNIIGNNFTSNEISYDTHNNKFGIECVFNDLGEDFHNNEIGNFFGFNVIGTSFNNNKIGNYFSDNQIGASVTESANFAYNEIGHNFYNNNIGHDFGFGGGQAYGNKVGNYFQNNNIGEYFYSNKIEDVFDNNTVGNYFQYNDVKVQNFYNYDLLSGYRNILSFTDNIGLSPSIVGTDGTYTGLTVSGGSGYGATFDVTVSLSVVTNVSINSRGYEYQVNNVLTIPYESFGGTSSSSNIEITVGSVSATPDVYGNYNCTIFKNANGFHRLSYYDANDVLNITDIIPD